MNQKGGALEYLRSEGRAFLKNSEKAIALVGSRYVGFFTFAALHHFIPLHRLSDMQTFSPKKYINVYLGLGSNMGDRKGQLKKATELISKTIGKVAKKSHFYETQPWGNTEQDSFINQVLMVNTTLDPRDILKEITAIEREMGRARKDNEKWGPRLIDIDILLYGKRIIRDKGLEIPHPELHKRAFVLVPLMEIAPEYEHPVLKQQIDELFMECEDNSDVIMLDQM